MVETAGFAHGEDDDYTVRIHLYFTTVLNPNNPAKTEEGKCKCAVLKIFSKAGFLV